MGKAVDEVNRIMNREENYAEWGLFFSGKLREWKKFNMLAGENGSGKSRVLQMIKRHASGDCVVFHLDFAKHMQHTGGSPENMEESTLVDMLLFRDVGKHAAFENFLGDLSDQILPVFQELFDMENDKNKRIKRRAAQILDAIKPSVGDILHRLVEVREDGIYLCKANRNVSITKEWDFLSPGERNILLVIFAMLYIELERKPCILLIDELETHLHPDAQVKLYRLLRRALEKPEVDCCVCIASHSIFLLPFFGIRELVYMGGGMIRGINGGLYQQIYDNLTGEGEQEGESLKDFFYSMDAWQYAEFLAQCFLDPSTVDEAKGDDQQAIQFVEVLKNLRGRKEMLEVLDFGAGTARIGRCVELMSKSDKAVQELLSGLKYHIYDKYNISEEFQENTAWMGRAYQSEEKIASDGIKFDLILLYNVLHEVGIDEWVKELEFILDSLTEGGLLVFGEREILSVGEKPYGKSGYLVLGKEELSALFPGAQIKEVCLPKKIRTATKCFTVEKPDTRDGYPDEESVKTALRLLRDNTKNKIRNRNNNGLGERGKSRKYAFYCQQYVNAEEAIEIVEGRENAADEAGHQDTEVKSEPRRVNKNTTLIDILSAPFSKREKYELIEALSQMNTAEGIKGRNYLVAHKEENGSLEL